MIQRKVCSIRVSELIITAMILTLTVILQEASWLGNFASPLSTSVLNVPSEHLNQLHQ